LKKARDLVNFGVRQQDWNNREATAPLAEPTRSYLHLNSS